MNIGKFKHKITFQYFTRVADGAGGFTQTWVDDLTCYARVEPLSPEETVEAGQQVQNNLFRIVIRVTNDFSRVLDNQYRIKYGTRIMNITAVRNLSFDDKFFQLLAVEK